MQISILGTDGALKANEGDLTSISVLAEDGSYLPNAGNTVLFVTGEDGAYQANDGTVNALSILGTDGALKPYEEGNSFSILDENGALNVETPIESLFSNGQQGAWYDPSDLSTMFQTLGGPAVTATGDVCGLILDKSLGLALGSELVANPSFDSATGWSLTPGWAISGGNLVMADIVTDSGQGAYHALSIATGEWVKVEIEVSAIETSSFYAEVCNDFGGTNTSGSAPMISSGAGTRIAYLPCTASQTGFRIRAQSGTGRSATIASVSVKKIAGNHAYQTTGARRPIFRDIAGLRYLEFDGVDDYLRATFTIAQPIDRISAIQQVTWTNTERIFGSVTANDAATVYQSTTTPRLDFYSGAGVNGATIAPALGTNAVLTERHNGASSRFARNSEAYITGNAGTAVPGGITLGAGYVPSLYSNIFLQQLIMRGSTTAMTDKEITTCRRLCYLKAGIPFPGEEELAVRLMWNSDQDAQGAWYDPSDLSTMFQGVNGEGVATATGQTIGLMLDKRLGMTRGSDLVTNGNFSVNTNWGTIVAGASIAGGVLAFDGATSITNGVAIASQALAPAVAGGNVVEVTYTIVADTTAQISVGFNGGSSIGVPRNAAGTYTDILLVSGTTIGVYARTTSAARTGSVDNIIVKKISGNHAYQATSGSRPVFRDVAGLRYLEFDGVDDYLRSTFTIAQPIDRISAIQQVSWTNGDYIFGNVSATAGILFQNSATPQVYTYSGGAALTPGASPAVGAAGVITERHYGANSRISAGNAAYTSGDTGTDVPGGITIAASGGGGVPANIYLHQLIMRGTVTALTDAQIAACRALCAIKSGVTL